MEKSTSTILKIAIVGAESTGKTTLCKQLASHYKTNYTDEKAREFFKKNSTKYSLEDILKIDKLQEQEEFSKIKLSKKFLFCDSTAITSAVWAKFVFQKLPEELEIRFKSEDISLYLLSSNDIKWEFDPLREHEFQRDEIFEVYKNMFEQYQKKFVILSGQNSERFWNAVKIIDSIFLSK